MRAGRVASICLVLLVTILATGVRALAFWVWDLESAAPVTRLLLFAAVVLLVAGALLIPLGHSLDQALVRLREQIESIAGDDAPGGAPAPVAGPAWLHPLTRALTGAVDRFIQRERTLRSQLRDLEIRHRVSEAERRQISAVLNSLRDGVVVTDPFNEIVMANAAAADILGFDLEAAIHQSIEQVVVDQPLCQLISDAREIADFADRRHVEHQVAVCAPSPGGGGDAGAGSGGPQAVARVFDVTLACVENHKHEVGGVVTILHDLTREREISQMKSDFVSKASHELRTPLSSIRAYVEMLIDGEASDDASRSEFYRVIQAETHRLGRLIDNMLNISRIEAGIVQIEREDVDLRGLIDRAVETIEPQAAEKSILIHTKLPSMDLTVEGDPDMLYQVVLNLLSNAVKYTPASGRITVASDTDNLTRSVVVTVTDTGLGIPPDALPKLFDKFFRVENYKRMATGTGLGLSLCKHIVETVHHGQIGVESKLGMGSKFWFSVPMHYAGSRAAA